LKPPFLKFPRDSFARDGSWIISPHPTALALYFATTGSFHAWKFFPILGQLVVDMLEGNLEAALAHKWAWERRMDTGEGDGGGVDKAPQREWSHLVDHDGDVDGERWGNGYIVVSGKERTRTTRARKERQEEEESMTKVIIAGQRGFCGFECKTSAFR
jgi:hypothetical protein